jgi:hypothetical protein
MWELRNPQAFDRETVGRIDMHLRKDREGWLPRALTFSVGVGEDGFIFKRSVGTFESADEATGLLPSDRTTLDALRSLGSSGALDKEWREEAMARGLGRTTYYRSCGTLVELGHVEKVMDKFFLKSPAKPESHEVPPESHGTNGTTAFGGESHRSHHPKGWDHGTNQAGTSEEWGEV